jgi:outer membrane protein assembly factor BamB
VIVVTTAGKVSSLDAATGQAMWKYDGFKTEDNDVYASPTLAGGRLYVACGGKVNCLGDVDPDATSGP